MGCYSIDTTHSCKGPHDHRKGKKAEGEGRGAWEGCEKWGDTGEADGGGPCSIALSFAMGDLRRLRVEEGKRMDANGGHD